MKNSCGFVFKALMLAGCLVFSGSTFSTETALPSGASSTPVQACDIGSPVDKTQVIVTQVLDVLKRDQQDIKGNFSKVEDDISAILSPSIDINKIADYVVPATLMQQATPEQRDA
ncbi:MAG: ABC transporter substrate-binding protein, partial [Gammaproteobacteria bacterium]|nr:ABC transporter substrate-binding protein [Gammaproteobacteria bacterium]